MYKVFILSALVGLSLGDHSPDPYKAPEPVYKAAPVAAAYRPAPAAYKEEEKLPPQPFAYKYGVKDDYTGADFDKAEEQDSYGNLQGEYRVQLPDGRTQIVRYKADHDNGFVADVSYEGVAQFPPEPKEGYGYSAPAPKYVPAAPAPKYKPAPAPYEA